MELTIMERVMLLNTLPEKGKLVNLKLLAELRSALSFNEEDIEAAGIIQNDETGMINWEENITKEFDLGKKTTEIIVKELTRLDAEEALTPQHMSLCEKFLED